MSLRTVIAIAIALAWSTAASAQSLGKVADQEASRRQGASAGKQYTNDSLKPERRGADAAPAPAPARNQAPASPAAATDTAPRGGSAPAAADTATTAGLSRAKEHRTEAYWRGRTKEIRLQMQRLQSEITRIEEQIESLGDQPRPASERQLTEAALNGLRADLQSIATEFEQFQARARRAKVPTDWMQ